MCPNICTNLNHNTIHARSLRIVKNLQNRIFRAIQTKNTKKAKNLQKLLLRSQSSIVLASDHVQQEPKVPQQIKNFEDTVILSKVIEKAVEPVNNNHDKSIYSPHSCLQKVKEFCAQEQITKAVTFDLKIHAISKFQKYVLQNFSYFPHKKQLKMLLEKKLQIQAPEKVVFYGQKISSKDIFWNVLGRDIFSITNDSNKNIKMFYNSGSVVILGKCEKDITKVTKDLYFLLTKAGVSVAHKKTCLLVNGFDFLGFTIKKASSEIRIKVNKYEVKKHIQHLKKLWMWAKGKDIQTVISKINKVVKKWSNSVCYQECTSILKKIRAYQLKKQQKWALSTHPNKSKQWVFTKYFGAYSSHSKSKWHFGIDSSLFMHEHLDFRL